MARILEPALGMSSAIARYGWYEGGDTEGPYGGVGVLVYC